MSFPDFGLQFLVIIMLRSLTSYYKGLRFPGEVYTFLISLTSYWIRLLRQVDYEKHSGGAQRQGADSPREFYCP